MQRTKKGSWQLCMLSRRAALGLTTLYSAFKLTAARRRVCRASLTCRAGSSCGWRRRVSLTSQLSA